MLAKGPLHRLKNKMTLCFRFYDSSFGSSVFIFIHYLVPACIFWIGELADKCPVHIRIFQLEVIQSMDRKELDMTY